jgi:putative transcriptional regulator
MSLKIHSQAGYLTGKLLISTPFIQDKQFEQSIVFVCGHDSKGAMGLMINKQLSSLTLQDVLQHLTKPIAKGGNDLRLYYGGPNESTRGFVLHTPDYHHESSTLVINSTYALTATLDILKDIMDSKGPLKALLALGYMAFKPGQLEQEIIQNQWLVMTPSAEFVFNENVSSSWQEAYEKLKINPLSLSFEKGCA